MAATATEKSHTVVKEIYVAWTSDASGDATVTTANPYDGDCIGLATDPDGTDAPTDNYDVTVTDGNSLDVLMGAGLNRDTANIEYVAGSSLGAVAGSTLTFTIANAGAAKKGVIALWIR